MRHTAPPRPAAPRSSSRGRGLWLLALAAVAGPPAVVPASAAVASVPADQPLVVLLRDHVARTAPRTSARRITTVRTRRPLTRVRTALPVLDRATTRGTSWVRVRLPGRPNGHSGWMPATHTMPASTTWRLALRRSTRTLTVYHEGRAVRRFRTVVGKPSTPTPVGQFFIEEVVRVLPGHPGGPFALATSALSTVLQEFEGGPGQVAIHGTRGLSGALGSAVSFGCVRISPSSIAWLARRVSGGAPLTITR